MCICNTDGACVNRSCINVILTGHITYMRYRLGIRFSSGFVSGSVGFRKSGWTAVQVIMVHTIMVRAEMCLDEWLHVDKTHLLHIRFRKASALVRLQESTKLVGAGCPRNPAHT